MYSFDDNAAVMTVLERLAGREEPLTQLMVRQPGAREARWVHLLSGPVEAGAGVMEAHVSEARPFDSAQGGLRAADLVGRVAALEDLVRRLEERLRVLERAGEADSRGE
jgi:uncharacterized protein YceH (UPF0502 family)